MTTPESVHPTILAMQQQARPAHPDILDADWLRDLVLQAGADDVGFVAVDDPLLAGHVDDLAVVLPRARSLVSFVVRMNRDPIRAVARSVANLEFHQATDETTAIARAIVRALEDRGVRAVNTSPGFPMEMDRWPDGKIWLVAHKPVAEAAGLGKMGIHRNVIHPRFGNFILLATIAVEATISSLSQPIAYNPCLDCKLCVAACPTGAIKPDGGFDFLACYTHNYREFMVGFTEWTETVAGSGSVDAYRERYSDSETASQWQSLAMGPNYKAAYCMAVCPAGEEVIRPFLEDRAGFVETMVRPLQRKEEIIYVLPDSDAEAYVAKRFPHKRVKRVGSAPRPHSIPGLLRGLKMVFQPGRAKGLTATLHLIVTGAETATASLQIADGTLTIHHALVGSPDVTLRADARTLLRCLGRKKGFVWAFARGRLRVSGSLKRFKAIGGVFATG
jgi:ferredoxin